MASLLNARTAVITGGAQGLGLAIGQRFVAEGARVVLGDVNLEATEVAAKRLGGDDVALAVRCDVTQADDVDILIRTAVERFGGLDVMVNNAGITRDATMRTMTEEQFDQVIAVHLKGTWNGTRLAAAIMRERKRGAIVNMSSVSGKVGMVGQTNYSAAKAGIVGNDQGGRQRTCTPRHSGKRNSSGVDPFSDDRSYAATHLGPEACRSSDGSRRRAQRSR
ncbi:3-ketoacyl-(acyl-carrier-protein) reductase [Mycobacterium tuberculosis RGTB327]|nr:3-ketoacyl-(acyl-carrier-protein) reductase [Mycobacterium tuberculosis RGTB327]